MLHPLGLGLTHATCCVQRCCTNTLHHFPGFNTPGYIFGCMDADTSEITSFYSPVVKYHKTNERGFASQFYDTKRVNSADSRSTVGRQSVDSRSMGRSTVDRPGAKVHMIQNLYKALGVFCLFTIHTDTFIIWDALYFKLSTDNHKIQSGHYRC